MHTVLIKAARHKEHMLYGSTSIHLKTLTQKLKQYCPWMSIYIVKF